MKAGGPRIRRRDSTRGPPSGSDRTELVRQLTRACARVAVDAVADALGRALPLSPAAFTDPDRFQSLVGNASFTRWRAGHAPSAIRITDQEAPSSNCRNSALRLEWQGGSSDLPRSLFLKQPSADLPTRVFANMIGFWRTECAVCRSLAHALPIDSPEIYAVDERRSRFFILMENLREREDVRLFVNRDFLRGVAPELAERCVRTLARLHAGFEGWDAERREAALPLALHPFLSPSLQPIMRAMNRLAVGRCLEKAGSSFGEADAALASRTLDHWPELLRAWYREPLTLVHGDSHLGNFFESRGELGMLDFQGAHWGRGPRDVHYFLVNSMAPDLLAQHEEALIAAYVEARAEAGAPVGADATWREYRGFSLQTLMTAVVSIGLGSFTDSDDVMQIMLARSVSAMRRLDFDGWLEATLARGSSGAGSGDGESSV